MHKLSIEGHLSELSEHDYLSSISNLANGYYILAEAYHNYHVSGFADWKGAFQISNAAQNETVNTITGAIDDDELSEAFNSLSEHLQELKVVDQKIVKWLVEFVGLSSLRGNKDKARLEQKLQSIIANGPDGRPQGPVWAMHPDYLVLVGMSKNTLAAIREDKRQVDQRLQQLLMEISTLS
jgi:hypothetical protein